VDLKSVADWNGSAYAVGTFVAA